MCVLNENMADGAIEISIAICSWKVPSFAFVFAASVAFNVLSPSSDVSEQKQTYTSKSFDMAFTKWLLNSNCLKIDLD